MKKLLSAFAFIALSFQLSAQTIPSPEQFLGYKIGDRFTPCFKVDAYFNAVAAANPSMVKVQKYGETYEHRDLLVAFIATPENLQKLEQIRQNNQRLAGILNDGVAADVNAPAIVWLSYNVHGNEPSSSEAAMLMLYEMAGKTDARVADWLKNTVVVIDPIQNPDGRDRYVNWYNNAVGESFNADPQSREHNEPWPRGRTNHYNFDLNRDWAWQTQIESQQRVKLYDSWLPQVHVDLHEQEPNNPYYFAPAAEPFHEVITPWQKQFQVLIGKNNAKYFDNNGWLYFTKEIFDMFYPSYGDTYPTYNGAIGMTYEQGGIDAGLGIALNDGDTLTLAQRAVHHFTTSVSTVEVASNNTSKLVTEFKKFFDDNKNGVGVTDKTYVLTSSNINKINEVKRLLDVNGIQYGITASNNFTGYNYFDGKNEAFTNEGYQLAVSTLQPKGKLARVLFEPQSKLSDSATYDITAWSIPYTYGINAWSVKDNLSLKAYAAADSVQSVTSSYGLIIPYNSFNSAEVLAYLINNNIKVRTATKPFTYKGKLYNRGALIVLKGANNSDWNNIVNKACNIYNVQAVTVETGFMETGADFGSSSVRFIQKPRVALLTGSSVSSSSAGEIWSFFDNELKYPITQLISNDLDNINLSSYNTLIIPDGSYRNFNNEDVQNKLKDFVNNGGKIIAFESGAEAVSKMDWTGIKLKEDSSADKKIDTLKAYGDDERSSLVNFIPGAIFKVKLDNTHPLGYGYPDFYYTLKLDGRLYEPFKNGWNVGVLRSSALTEGFTGSTLKKQIHDGIVIGEKSIGNGHIVIMNEDPIFRLFWQNGKLMLANAVFMVGD